ncbi:MAG: VanZ family protein [Bacilli bacterium]
MNGLLKKLHPFRIWFLAGFILSNTFIAGNSLLSAEESGDLSTGISEVIISVARAILPPATVVEVPAENITLNLRDNATTIYIGTSNRITPTFSPVNTTDKTIGWTSNNPSIIEVTNGGIAVARDFGSATITANTIYNNVFAEILIEVIDFPTLVDFTLEAFINDNPTSTIEKDTTAKLKLNNLAPTNAKTTGLLYTSSNVNIATVNEDGVIYGVMPGEVTITASLGVISRSINVTIVDEIEVIQPTMLSLIGDRIGYIGRNFTLITSFGEITPTDTQVTFQSSNTRVAKINDQGLVTPVNFSGYAPQDVTITVYANANPLLQDSFDITIEKVFPLSLQIASTNQVENGRTTNINPTFYPLDVTDRQLTYVSSDPSIATVSSAGDFGVVLGKDVGTVTITAISVMDPSVQATLQIEVIPATLLTPDVITNIYLFVRKGIGHMGLNFLNGILGFLTFFTYLYDKKNRYLWISIGTGFVLGLVFEGLQFFAPGRSPVWIDVAYNTIGYTFAQLLMVSLLIGIKKRSNKKIKT